MGGFSILTAFIDVGTLSRAHEPAWITLRSKDIKILIGKVSGFIFSDL